MRAIDWREVRHPFFLETSLAPLRLGVPFIEIPVQWYYDGDSKVSVIRDSLKMFRELLQIRKNYKAGLYN